MPILNSATGFECSVTEFGYSGPRLLSEACVLSIWGAATPAGRDPHLARKTLQGGTQIFLHNILYTFSMKAGDEFGLLGRRNER